MSPIPILSGVYASPDGSFRVSYPRNMVPVPMSTGISSGYLKPADGILSNGTGQGLGRGGINWNGSLYRVSGTKLVKVSATGVVQVLGDVGGSEQVRFDYSFDRLSIASGGSLFYWSGSTLSRVADTDLGTVLDQQYIAGYFMTTDGNSIIVTDLNDPMSVNPLRYGSSEADPDPIVSVRKLRNEAYAFNRYTIEVFENVGQTSLTAVFPFSPIEGALVPRGAIGTHAICSLLQTFAFVGSGRNEAPAVWLMLPGATQKLSTREIDIILAGYSDSQLASIVVESKVEKSQESMMIHLPDQCLVYDAAASAALQQPVWYTLTSSLVGAGQYRARGIVWCYNQWNVDDPTSSALGKLTSMVSSQYGQVNGWDFGTMIFYDETTGGFVFHSMELVGAPGRVALGADPTIWTSYSLDGETWSMEKPKKAGKQGERTKQIAWRKLGSNRFNYRIQRFRGTTDAHMSIAALSTDLEPLGV